MPVSDQIVGSGKGLPSQRPGDEFERTNVHNGLEITTIPARLEVGQQKRILVNDRQIEPAI